MPSQFNEALPNHFEILPKLEKKLKQYKSLGLMILILNDLDVIEHENGYESYTQVLHKLCHFIKQQRGHLYPKNTTVCFSDVGHPSFLFFFHESLSNDAYLSRYQIKQLSKYIRFQCSSQFMPILQPFMKRIPKILTGSSLTLYNELTHPRRTILRMVEDVKNMTRAALPAIKVKYRERIQDIIISQNLSTVFHPIMDFNSNKPMGFEALSRGPKGTNLESPHALFSMAKEVGLLFELDRVCRLKAIEAAQNIPDAYKVFINIMPTTIYDPEFKGKKMNDYLKSFNKKPSQFIFEINERDAIENYSTFAAATEYYMRQGFSFAIDDTGTGYSALEAVIELKPKYLKCDISMVNGIHKNKVKQEMLKMLSLLANKINAKIIAEGIEQTQDFELLKNMGLILGQGFLFSTPKESNALMIEA